MIMMMMMIIMLTSERAAVAWRRPKRACSKDPVDCSVSKRIPGCAGTTNNFLFPFGPWRDMAAGLALFCFTVLVTAAAS